MSQLAVYFSLTKLLEKLIVYILGLEKKWGKGVEDIRVKVLF